MQIIRRGTVAHACYDYNYQAIEIRLFELQGMNGDRAIGLPITYAIPKNDGERMEPTVCLRGEQAQQLMDALWDVGVRPAQGHGSSGQLAATLKHLEDMRAMAFSTLAVEAPK